MTNLLKNFTFERGPFDRPGLYVSRWHNGWPGRLVVILTTPWWSIAYDAYQSHYAR